MNAVQTGQVVPYLAEMFRYQAWVALGKIAHPVSQEVERNLEAAKQSIDLLAELDEKTKGNLSEDETKLLQGILTELRMNYVDEANRPDPEESAEGETAAVEAGEGNEEKED